MTEINGYNKKSSGINDKVKCSVSQENETITHESEPRKNDPSADVPKTKYTSLQVNQKLSDFEIIKLKCKYSDKRKSLPTCLDDSFEQFVQDVREKNSQIIKCKSESDLEKLDNYNIGAIVNTPSVKGKKRISKSVGHKKTVQSKHRSKCKKKLIGSYLEDSYTEDIASISSTLSSNLIIVSPVKNCKLTNGLIEFDKQSSMMEKQEENAENENKSGMLNVENNDKSIKKHSKKKKVKSKHKEKLKLNSSSDDFVISNGELAIGNEESYEREKDKPIPKVNAFQIMMESRYKSIGMNSSGKELRISEEESTPKSEKKQESQKRKLMLEKWAENKGSKRRKVQDELQEEYINKTLEKRAVKLKKMLRIQDENESKKKSDTRLNKPTKTSPVADRKSVKRKKPAPVIIESDSDQSDLVDEKNESLTKNKDVEKTKTLRQKSSNLHSYFNTDNHNDKSEPKTSCPDVAEETNEASSSIIKVNFPFTPKKEKNLKLSDSERKKKHKKHRHVKRLKTVLKDDKENETEKEEVVENKLEDEIELGEEHSPTNREKIQSNKKHTPAKRLKTVLKDDKGNETEKEEVVENKSEDEIELGEERSPTNREKIQTIKKHRHAKRLTLLRDDKENETGIEEVVENKLEDEMELGEERSPANREKIQSIKKHRHAKRLNTVLKDEKENETEKEEVENESEDEVELVEEHSPANREKIQSIILVRATPDSDDEPVKTIAKRSKLHINKNKWKLKIKCNGSSENGIQNNLNNGGIDKNNQSQQSSDDSVKSDCCPDSSDAIFTPVKERKFFKAKRNDKIDAANKIKNKALKFVSPSKKSNLSPVKIKSVTPKNVKLAPLFVKKKSVPMPKEDFEFTEAKRNFLISGVPSSVKRIVEKQKRDTDDYVFDVFPSVSHIQQKYEPASENSVDIWNLPAAELNYRTKNTSAFDSKSLLENKMFIGMFSDRSEQNRLKIIYAPPLKMFNYRTILHQIKRENPNFPVYKIFRLLREKNKSKSSNSIDATQDENTLTRPTKTNKLKLKKNSEKNKKQKSGNKSAESVIKKSDKNDELDKSIEIIEDPSTSNQEPIESTLYSVWSEKYKPNSSDDIIGNSNCVRELKQWLQSWITYTADTKRIKNKRNESDSDDFIVLDEDTKDSSHSLCNATVLIGPCGSGKTSTVYALTNELGINVLEINASSKRAGRKILTELQEATQSHLVGAGAANNVQDLNGFFKKNSAKEQTSTVKSKKIKEHQSKVKNKTKDLNNYFDTNGKKSDQNGDKMETKSDDCSQAVSKMSLILVEDVDLFFEDEDEGFISAIGQLLATSKRPVILVSSDSTCLHVQKFTNQYPVIEFSPLSGKILGVWLRLVCLLENILVDQKSVEDLLESNSGDIRKTLLQLQFWVNSGGDSEKISNSTTYSEIKPVIDTEKCDRLSGNSIENEDDNSSMSWLSNETDSLNDTVKHSNCVNSFLQTHLSDVNIFRSCNQIYPLNLGNIYWNIHLFLNFPDVGITHKNISNRISDTNISENSKTTAVDDKIDTKIIKTDESVLNSKQLNSETKQYQSTCEQSEMDAVSDLYECLVLIDMAYSRNGLFDKEPAPTLKPFNLIDSLSVLEDFRHYSNKKQQTQEWTYFISNRVISKCKTVFKSEYKINLLAPTADERKWRVKQCSSHNELLNAIPVSNILDNSAVFTDYQSILRTICRLEQYRQLTNTKRSKRFFHYLKGLNVHCSDNMLDILCTTLVSN